MGKVGNVRGTRGKEVLEGPAEDGMGEGLQNTHWGHKTIPSIIPSSYLVLLPIQSFFVSVVDHIPVPYPPLHPNGDIEDTNGHIQLRHHVHSLS